MPKQALAQKQRRLSEMQTRPETFYGRMINGSREVIEKGKRKKRGPIPAVFKKRLTCDIEPKLWKLFKDKLIKRNQTISEGLIEGIRLYLSASSSDHLGLK